MFMGWIVAQREPDYYLQATILRRDYYCCQVCGAETETVGQINGKLQAACEDCHERGEQGNGEA